MTIAKIKPLIGEHISQAELDDYCTATGKTPEQAMEHLKNAYFYRRIMAYCTANHETECCEWNGRRSRGIPFITLNWCRERVNLTVRRFLYEHHNGASNLTQSQTVSTTCGNPDCVNPTHLMIGHGAGSKKGNTIAEILKRYFMLKQSCDEKLTMRHACKELNVSFVTLKRYLAMYDKEPEKWRRLWGTL